jgi:hypothetical protein
MRSVYIDLSLITSLQNINWSVSKIQTKSVYCEVRNDSLRIIQSKYILRRGKTHFRARSFGTFLNLSILFFWNVKLRYCVIEFWQFEAWSCPHLRGSRCPFFRLGHSCPRRWRRYVAPKGWNPKGQRRRVTSQREGMLKHTTYSAPEICVCDLCNNAVSGFDYSSLNARTICGKLNGKYAELSACGWIWRDRRISRRLSARIANYTLWKEHKSTREPTCYFLCTVNTCSNSVILILTALSSILRNYAKVKISVQIGTDDNYLHKKKVHNGLNSGNCFPSRLLSKNLHFKHSCLLYLTD